MPLFRNVRRTSPLAALEGRGVATLSAASHKEQHMIKTISTAGIALVLAAGASSAMAQETPNWTGPYIGIYGGGIEQNDQDDERLRFDRNFDGDFGDSVVTTTGADAFSPGSCGSAPNANSFAAGCNDDSTGVEAGIRAGYDYQFGSFVVGGLVEYSATDVEDSVTSFSTTPASYTFSRKLESLAAARLRLGYAVGPALIYGTGGYAYGEVSNRFYSSNTGNAYSAQIDEDEADGWQAGGGVEYALTPNLSVTGEYLYSSLEPGDFVVRFSQGSQPATNPFILPPNTVGTDVNRSNGRFGMHAVRIGMNYRF